MKLTDDNIRSIRKRAFERGHDNIVYCLDELLEKREATRWRKYPEEMDKQVRRTYLVYCEDSRASGWYKLIDWIPGTPPKEWGFVKMFLALPPIGGE